MYRLRPLREDTDNTYGVWIWHIRDKNHPFFAPGRRHDISYIVQTSSRKEVDRELLYGMLDNIEYYDISIYAPKKFLIAQAYATYALVRLFGWRYWNSRGYSKK